MYNYGGGTASFSGSTVSGNSAILGGGICNGYNSTITLTDTTISGNSATSGGGILNYYYAKATLTGSTISGNTASDVGGGVGNSGTLTLTNCTIENNTAVNNGGGLFNANYGTATVTDMRLPAILSRLRTAAAATFQLWPAYDGRRHRHRQLRA